MTEQARIISMDDSLVTLACMDEGSCASCRGKGFCNVQGKQYTAVNKNGLELSLGDDVEIYLPPGKTIFSGFMVMMLPLITFTVGFLLTARILPDAGEAQHAAGGFLGLAAGFLGAYFYGRTQKKISQPEILRVIRRHTAT